MSPHPLPGRHGRHGRSPLRTLAAFALLAVLGLAPTAAAEVPTGVAGTSDVLLARSALRKVVAVMPPAEARAAQDLAGRVGILGEADGPTVPASVADWANVVAVRINVLARNLEATTGYTDTRTYDMGAAGNLTPLGSYKRHVYNSVIRLVNPASRRES